jgi:hypothetical protein
MALRQSILAALVGFLSIGVQLTYAAPTRCMSERCAARCRARHCDHAHIPNRANDCCGIQQTTHDTALLSAPTQLERPQAVGRPVTTTTLVELNDGIHVA